MGRLLLAVALVGCTHGATTSPAWPKQAVSDKDGGESIAPHESSKAIAVVEKAEVETKPDAKPEVVKPAVAVPEAGAAPAAAAAVTSPTDEAITTEDIIIEIDD